MNMSQTQWYRVFSDLYIEEGGRFTQASTATNSYTTVAYPKPLPTYLLNIAIICGPGGSSGWQYWGGVWCNDYNLTQMTVGHSLGATGGTYFFWSVSGF